MRARRSFADVRVEEIVTERSAALALARGKCGEIDALVARGRMTAEDATSAKRWLRAFAEALAQGLHREREEPLAVRRTMRLVLVDFAREPAA